MRGDFAAAAVALTLAPAAAALTLAAAAAAPTLAAAAAVRRSAAAAAPTLRFEQKGVEIHTVSYQVPQKCCLRCFSGTRMTTPRPQIRAKGNGNSYGFVQSAPKVTSKVLLGTRMTTPRS